MLKGVDIHKSYGQLEVLKGIHLEVKKSEVVSIVGTSGAGKSTLLHIIGTLDLPDRGEVIIDEVAVNQLKSNELARFRNAHIGFVFQFHHLLPEFTALENVCIPAYIKGQSEKAVADRAKTLLDLLGLSARMTHKPSELSGGEQQRVAVARALINTPSVVMADEPSGNLDSDNSRQLHRRFFDLRSELQQTFIIATHNQELAAMADRKLTIRDGTLLQ